MRELAVILSWVIVIAVVITTSAFGGYYAVAFFAPRYAAIQRDTMINSRAYSEATVRELYRLKRQYEAAKTDNEKQTIAAAAIHEFEIFPEERLPAELAGWFTQIR